MGLQACNSPAVGRASDSSFCARWAAWLLGLLGLPCVVAKYVFQQVLSPERSSVGGQATDGAGPVGVKGEIVTPYLLVAGAVYLVGPRPPPDFSVACLSSRWMVLRSRFSAVGE